MKDLEPLLQTWARLAIALGYFTGIMLIVGWSIPGRVATDRRADPAMRVPDTRVSGATATANLIHATGRTRSQANCAECGVVESVRMIDRREEFARECDAGEFANARVIGKVPAVGGRDDVESLADTVAVTIASEYRVKKVAVAARHQIVVRFRDGTRHVFDEATPRTLRVGDRINVIAVAAGASS